MGLAAKLQIMEKEGSWKINWSHIVYPHPTSGEWFYLKMLLNVVKGPRSFKEIRTINGVRYPTYEATCYALGLLDGDQEWHDAIL